MVVVSTANSMPNLQSVVRQGQSGTMRQRQYSGVMACAKNGPRVGSQFSRDISPPYGHEVRHAHSAVPAALERAAENRAQAGANFGHTAAVPRDWQSLPKMCAARQPVRKAAMPGHRARAAGPPHAPDARDRGSDA